VSDQAALDAIYPEVIAIYTNQGVAFTTADLWINLRTNLPPGEELFLPDINPNGNLFILLFT